MQWTIQYVRLDGLSAAEAARHSGMTEATIEISIHRGLKTLSAAIRPEGRS